MNDNLAEISQKIKLLQENDFTSVVTNDDNKKMFVKDLTKSANASLNPVNPQESQIQALRHLRGMLLIVESSLGKRKDLLQQRVTVSYDKYLQYMEKAPGKSFLHTCWLIEQFAQALIQPGVDMRHARKQVTMAKDLGILLEEHPVICTITDNNGKTTTEKSTPVKISAEYYDKYFSNLNSQVWYQNAINYAGLTHANDNWLESFFAQHVTDLKQYAVSAPPSARWLPLPANNQVIEIQTGKTAASYIRTGTVAAFEIKKEAEQETLAIAQLKELIKQQLVNKIEQYKSRYAEILPTDKNGKFTFFVNYQTFLTPQIGETILPHKDNNGKFIALTKKAVAALASDPELQKLGSDYGARLVFCHTNAAINRHAGWVTAKNSYVEDDQCRSLKLAATNILANANLDGIRNPDLLYEISLRITANNFLKKLLHPDASAPALKTYQHNIMVAALEYLAMGSQAITLAGCKSARDRTAVFAAAVKTMLENPLSMSDWKALEKGICTTLLQGHHFRSMQNHCGVVKVDLVHEDFMKEFPQTLKADIKELQVFANTAQKFTGAEVDSNRLFVMKPGTAAVNEPAAKPSSQQR